MPRGRCVANSGPLRDTAGATTGRHNARRVGQPRAGGLRATLYAPAMHVPPTLQRGVVREKATPFARAGTHSGARLRPLRRCRHWALPALPDIAGAIALLATVATI